MQENNFKYLIVGGGMTADSAVQGIRQLDPSGIVGMISAESDKPYNRPPLSKGLWKNKSIEGIYRKTETMDVKMFNGCTVVKINPQSKEVVDSNGNVYGYEKLLIATGGRPRRLPFGGDDIIYFRTLEDYRRLRALTDKFQSFAVIGGGFIGTEIAAALAMNKKEVVMIFPEKGICGRILPENLSESLNRYYREKGVKVLAGESVTGFEKDNDRITLTTSSGRKVIVDGVVAGLGIEPDIQLAGLAGIETDNGIKVDLTLCSSQPDIYAAGDVASFYNHSIGRSIRAEHEDNANMMGLHVGRNMAGSSEPYLHLPFFYSDLFDVGYEAVGILDSRLETYGSCREVNDKGDICYMQNGRICGMLLWNIFGKVETARKLITLVRFNTKSL